MERDGRFHLSRPGAPEERAILVGVHLPISFDHGRGGTADLDELERLVSAAGAEAVGVLEQQRMRPEPATYIGRGKVEELKEAVARTDANLVVFDNELTPAQGRNLEKAAEVRVVDRTELILDIFARHARTRQARLQVELAQLLYFLPRLTRLWSHLERQAGGIGTRGPGETQLESDRRLVRQRIAQLKRQLATIAVGRDVRVKQREGIYRAALVGYTNAGKSTLMNAVAGADVLVQDQLFATLDATTRRVAVDERHRFLLTDTVGFIRRLPHHLVESFHATLAEVGEADLLVHVVDAGSSDPERQIRSVNKVLDEVAPGSRPTLMVFNKIDTVDAETFINRYQRHYPDSLFVSAVRPEGGATVRATILRRLQDQERTAVLDVPAGSFHALQTYHRTGAILRQDWCDGRCTVTVRAHPEELRRLVADHPDIRLRDSA
ncbi:MAG: GTPase HflX [Candidatus Krumholzibacteriia bacterium]